MGMFDYFVIDTEMLPITDEEKKELGDDPRFQTKDFECILTTAEITKGGKLRYRDVKHEWDESIKNGFGTMGVMVEKEAKWVEINKHGFVNFYKLDKNGNWWEFNAKFTDGKLVEITGGKE